MGQVTQLTHGFDYEALFEAREAMRQRAETIERLAAECKGDGIWTMRNSTSIELTCRGSRRDFSAETYMREFDSEAWRKLIELSGIHTFMDAQAREDWSKALDSRTFPALTMENIEATMDDLRGKRLEFVSRGVANLFRRLSPDHVTNDHTQWTRRVITRYAVEGWGYGNNKSFSPTHRFGDELDDLERTLYVVRGTPPPDRFDKYGMSTWNRLSKVTGRGKPMRLDLAFFSVRLFLKGTGHIEFRHEEDVRKLNLLMSVHTGGKLLTSSERSSFPWL